MTREENKRWPEKNKKKMEGGLGLKGTSWMGKTNVRCMTLRSEGLYPAVNGQSLKGFIVG